MFHAVSYWKKVTFGTVRRELVHLDEGWGAWLSPLDIAESLLHMSYYKCSRDSDSVMDIHLSEVQLAVMRALWTEREATTATVHEIMGKPRSLAYTTVATLLSRLEKRGVVRSTKLGRERVYSPLVSEADVKHHMVSDLVANLFRGDPQALMSHLVTGTDFDDGDLETIRQLLADRPGEQEEQGR